MYFCRANIPNYILIFFPLYVSEMLYSVCCFNPWFAVAFQAEGYSDGDLTLYHIFSLSEFLKAENPVDFLSKANKVGFKPLQMNISTCVFLLLTSISLLQITFDNPELEAHPITSAEIKECCSDIKVLGRKELR